MSSFDRISGSFITLVAASFALLLGSLALFVAGH
jgi:hypothetical protein